MSHDTLVHRALRPFVRRLARTRVQPNHVTAARIATAAVAAWCFAAGGGVLLDVGCALFGGSALLDRIDGELARLTGRFSPWGHRLDLMGDCAADALAFLALGYGSRVGRLGVWAPVLGVGTAASIVALFWQFNIRRHDVTRRSPVRCFDPDDAMFLVPVLLLCAGPPPVLLLGGILTPIVAACAIWRRMAL